LLYSALPGDTMLFSDIFVSTALSLIVFSVASSTVHHVRVVLPASPRPDVRQNLAGWRRNVAFCWNIYIWPAPPRDLALFWSSSTFLGPAALLCCFCLSRAGRSGPPLPLPLPPPLPCSSSYPPTSPSSFVLFALTSILTPPFLLILLLLNL
jgi:hypothetical protein